MFSLNLLELYNCKKKTDYFCSWLQVKLLQQAKKQFKCSFASVANQHLCNAKLIIKFLTNTFVSAIFCSLITFTVDLYDMLNKFIS